MTKKKKKMTAAQKAAKKQAQKEFMWIFMNGRQVRVKRPPTIDGMDLDEFIMNNADPIWLHQNEMWEYIKEETRSEDSEGEFLDLSEEDEFLDTSGRIDDIHQEVLPYFEEDDIPIISDDQSESDQ